MTSKKDPVSVKDVLPAVLKSIASHDVQEQISLEQLWQDILKEEANRAVIAGFKDGCVFASVDSPLDLFRMRMRKPEWVRRLKEKRKDIVNIVFRMGRKT